MIKNNNDKGLHSDEDEIDLVALIRTIIHGKRIVYISVVICVLIALCVGVFSPLKYKATATLLPSPEAADMNGMGGLGALAGMAGINVSSMLGGSSNAIQADIYPQIVESYPFKNEMMKQEFYYLDHGQEISLYDYVIGDTIPSIGDLIIKYTIRLPWTIKDAFSSDVIANNKIEYGVINLTQDEIDVLKTLEGYFTIEVDTKNLLISITAEDSEPILVAQKVDKALDLLQDYIKAHKTKLERHNVKFLEEMYIIKEKEYNDAQIALFEYQDKHRNTIKERTNFEIQQLTQKHTMASTIFNSVAQQLEQAKITLEESTPAFTIIEPAIVPDIPSWPKKSILLIIGVFSGVFIGVCCVLAKELFVKIKEEL